MIRSGFSYETGPTWAKKAAGIPQFRPWWVGHAGWQLSTVNGGRTLSEYQVGKVIFQPGDAADSVFYVAQGKVKIAVNSEQGKEAVVTLLGEGDFFGEGSLIGQPLRLATASAMVASRVMRVETPEMIRVLHADPSLPKSSRLTC